MSRVVPRLPGAFAARHRDDRSAATRFPRAHARVATVRAASARAAREPVGVDGDRDVAHGGGMGVPHREALPGDVIVNSEGRGFMVFRGWCRPMPGLTDRVEPPPHPPVGHADGGIDR